MSRIDRWTRASFAGLMLLASASSLHAQKGCFHSPEAPTGILMLVGSASMFYGSSAVMQMIRRKRSSTR